MLTSLQLFQEVTVHVVYLVNYLFQHLEVEFMKYRFFLWVHCKLCIYERVNPVTILFPLGIEAFWAFQKSISACFSPFGFVLKQAEESSVC